jgi:Fe-S-cluster-containing dehydrogenase component
MPDIDGIDLIEQAKRKRPELAVVVITGYPSVETAVTTLKLGAAEYVPKPFTPDELADRVRCAFEKQQQSSRSSLPEAETVTPRIVKRALQESSPKGSMTITADLESCMACLTCVVECGAAHLDREAPERAPLKDVFNASRVHIEAAGGYPVPVRCVQCNDAPCIRACPTGAVHRDSPREPVTINHQICIGCEYCVLACPFGAIYSHDDSRMIIKCDLCADRIAPGEEPVCVRNCPVGALRYERLDDVARRKREEAAQNLLVSFVAEDRDVFGREG